MRHEFMLLSLLFVVAMVLSGVATALVQAWARRVGYGQTVRDNGPQSHLVKMGTPTLGGVGIFAAIALLTVAFWAWRQFRVDAAVPLALGLALLYAGLGFADDWSKLRYKRPLGLKARVRVPVEIALAGLFAFLLIHTRVVTAAGGLAQIIPLGAGVGFVLFSMFVIVGAGNAVNLTDGLDGLAGGVSCFCALAMAVACLFLGRADLAVLCIIVSGATAGFLWLNAHPASIFMGDVGSLGLGAILAAVAVSARLEVVFALCGIVFVVEAVSVILQVLYFKYSHGKRIFRMAPFHHHLELGGMPETKIVIRFWLVTLAAGALGIGIVSALVMGV